MKCDMMLVIGSSLDVSPASELPALAKSKKNAFIVEIKRNPSRITKRLTDVILRGEATEVLSKMFHQHIVGRYV